MNFVLIDDSEKWKDFLPLAFTRPLSEIRIGILTIKEKWEHVLNAPCSYFVQKHLSAKYPPKEAAETILINSGFCPTHALCESILALKAGEALFLG